MTWGSGKRIDVHELSEIFLREQDNNAENINLVSPTIYVDLIVQAIKEAKEKGLSIPIVYNSNGYEKVCTLRKLEGLVDVYLPDLKYSDDSLGVKFSKVNNYFEIATKAIKEMERQVGSPKFDDRRYYTKGAYC